MPLTYNHIKTYLKHLIFALVFCAVVVQPCIQLLTLITDADYELVLIDTEKESDEKEKQKDDPKDEKTELKMIPPYHRYSYGRNHSIQHAYFSVLHSSFCATITIPPPELG